jgi:hypothetical protein
MRIASPSSEASMRWARARPPSSQRVRGASILDHPDFRTWLRPHTHRDDEVGAVAGASVEFGTPTYPGRIVGHVTATTIILVTLVFSGVLAYVPAAIAESKGYNHTGRWRRVDATAGPCATLCAYGRHP